MNKGEKTCVYRFPLFSLYYKNRLSYIRKFKVWKKFGKILKVMKANIK